MQALSGLEGLTIGEIGGGASRVLPELAKKNSCFNIEPFEGADNGPQGEVKLPGVTNIPAIIGKTSSEIEDGKFDVLFSISVVEHINDDDFQAFYDDCIRILKPGGRMYHAVDMYIASDPTPFWRNRFEMYRNSVQKREDVTPLGECFDGELVFTPDIASNPDNIMYGWRQISPALDDLRQMAQSVSIKMGVTKAA